MGALALCVGVGAAVAPVVANQGSKTEKMAPKEAKAGGTIVDVAAANQDFSTLVKAVKAAGLVDTLAGPGPLTVFAPTNAAIAAAISALASRTSDILSTGSCLRQILT
ncbi:MAG: hypothetical protein HC918_08130, partial [Oscillatoriales cyanobacterium SM2_1_8]|nr:hypothetical protein [Oscillatoriales cyanobacterium SM2_1_8]